jgi:histidine triad (HIT) family protein
MTDCLFCKILNGEMDSDIVHEDDHVVGFRDINPQAPHHVLFIPRQHIATLNDLNDGHAELMGRLFLAAKQYANENGIADEGYRTVVNCNEGAGQSVFHVHLHLLGGRPMTWTTEWQQITDKAARMKGGCREV